MARKIKLAYIPNYIARKTTFKKRKVGIVKKLHELTTLCAIKACLVMYSVYDPEPFVWPSNDEARKLIERFRSFSVEDQRKRKVNQETYMRQSLEKLEEKLRKMEMENRRKEVTHIMFQSLVDTQAALSRLDMGGYVELRKAISKSMMEAQRMMDMRSREGDSFNPQAGSVGGSGGGQIQSSNITFPPPPIMELPTINMPFPPPPSPHGGAGGSGTGGVSGSQHFSLGHHQYMPPNQYEGFQSYGPNFSMPNLMFPPPLPMANMSFPPPPQGSAGPSGSGGGQQLGLRLHEFMMPDPNQHERVQPWSPHFSMPNVAFPPPNMAFPPPPSMSFPPYDMAYMDPINGMPYPGNQPMFPYYHNDDIGPHDPSFH